MATTTTTTTIVVILQVNRIGMKPASAALFVRGPRASQLAGGSPPWPFWVYNGGLQPETLADGS
eukprot:1161035-Pelagomonas_calceolata.AAC.9